VQEQLANRLVSGLKNAMYDRLLVWPLNKALLAVFLQDENPCIAEQERLI
jgi:hypothetical protein